MLVTAYLQTHPRAYLFPSSPPSDEPLYASLCNGEVYQARRTRCMQSEAILLRTLGYQIHVAIPHTLCINYLQTLGAFQHRRGKAVAARAFAHLNSALLSPQLIYLTHQPTSLAAVSVYLAAREEGLKLPERAWWELFDVSREELGFLVAGLTSMTSFSQEEENKWRGAVPPMHVDQMLKVLQKPHEDGK